MFPLGHRVLVRSQNPGCRPQSHPFSGENFMTDNSAGVVIPFPDRFCSLRRPKTTLFVIPAKAGIQFFSGCLDSCIRGNNENLFRIGIKTTFEVNLDSSNVKIEHIEVDQEGYYRITVNSTECGTYCHKCDHFIQRHLFL
ncbi:hypothetical protein BN874_80055 [Candidatus Contendobacter odensis Run_B_J11]|uniref:Uncharacterized protein n=1 Tax=Candidatus Contendobacter odensis Run_B_J11 TaxID=1400861 RepID=A0A7U7GFC8_9GAMM|nr:hypothetical protein BN874_80055 [Candidatus Contendobacter odensis Run_B_J11]